jgi:xanthine dehydrogenase accessory factor
MESKYEILTNALAADNLIAQATVLSGSLIGAKMLFWPDGGRKGDLGSGKLEKSVSDAVETLFQQQETRKLEFDIDGEKLQVFVEVYPPSPRLVVVGAVHIALPLTDLAKTMGFRTIVVDARSAFTTRERFPRVDELIVAWPSEALEELHLDEGTYVAILSHDAKFDIPALQVAVESKARYVGVLASKQTYNVLYEALKENGVPEELLAKVHTPIGIKKLGARGPEGIAFSIIAEMIAEMRGVHIE